MRESAASSRGVARGDDDAAEVDAWGEVSKGANRRRRIKAIPGIVNRRIAVRCFCESNKKGGPVGRGHGADILAGKHDRLDFYETRTSLFESQGISGVESGNGSNDGGDI